MTSTQLDFAWIGGATERRLRKRRPGSERLPWGTLDATALSADELTEAKLVWTNAAFTEYASAAAFSSLASACLESGAPIDLTATIADCAVDELAHVELASRLLAELGGAAPFEFDLANVSPATPADARPLMRACEIAITSSCVGESLSLPALRHGRASTRHPLARAVIQRLLAEEGPHARVGFTLLAWAETRLTAGERAHLASVALDAIAAYASLWQANDCTVCPRTVLTSAVDGDYRAGMKRAVIEQIARPLATLGIALDPQRLAQLAA